MKGNKKAKGTPGNKGGGRNPLPEHDRKDKHVRLSWRLWDKIQVATMTACENNWRVFLESLLDAYNNAHQAEQSPPSNVDTN